MNDKQHRAQPSGGMSLGDVYFVLFRHKWKIIICSLIGLAGGIGFYFFHPPVPYESQAILYVKYVLETGTPTPNTDPSKPEPAADLGARALSGIMDSEMQILSSLDLAQQVVNEIGASNILAQAGGGDDPNQAAILVRKGLTIGVDANDITITFKHPDRHIVQDTLSKLIADYVNKSIEIHQGGDMLDTFLESKQQEAKNKIALKEQALANAKAKAGIIYPDDADKTYADQLSKLHQQIFDAENELAERQAALGDISAATPAVVTNDPAIFANQLDEYKDATTRLGILQKKESDYLTQGFSEGNVLVQEVKKQIADVKKIKNDLEEKNPRLINYQDSTGQPDDFADAAGDSTRIEALKLKIRMLSARMDQMETNALAANEAEATISELQREKEIEEANYQYYSSYLGQTKLNEELKSDNILNIESIQKPSIAFKEPSTVLKTMLMIIFGGVAGGLALAFAMELYLDRSVKRPSEIEVKLGLPLFLSIPYVSDGDRRRLAKSKEKLRLQWKNAEGNGSDNSAENEAKLEVASWNDSHSLRPFYEALRDRLIAHFEAKNLTRKPKLVAVTNVARGSGASTIASGLAASLSETGDGNVLLVGMNSEHDIAQQFYKGKPGCHLDDILESGKRDDAMVQENLYVVTEGANGNKVPRLLPKRFMAVLPKLKVSDYDYIIFDMPPVTQTSVTPRLAGFMDFTLMVVESEKTDRDVVRRASALLEESNAHVSIVLNKTRKYVPTRLHQDFLSDT